ncbi:MAG: transcriptional repressor [Campylobacteraceae bacterium]|jgi:Fur family ferric uptake transcriptional regulator|nr:transcriptional repressor [Campylobacteraceae bacterium]
MNGKTKKLLQKSGIKPTNAREAIMDILNTVKAPLSYEQIRSLMKSDMDKATFYRNISLFEEAGVVQKFESDERKWYFELLRKSHAHFVCEQCHNIICIDLDIGADIKEHQVKNVVIKGLCKECK